MSNAKLSWKRKEGEKTHRGTQRGMPCKEGGRDQRDGATNQRLPGLPSNSRSSEMAMERIIHQSFWGTNLAKTLILEFNPAAL